MKYEVGDKVRIGNERTRGMNSIGYMDRYLGTVMTIKCIKHYGYIMEEDNHEWSWTDDMIEGKVDMNKDMLRTGDIAVLRDGVEFLVLRGDFDTVKYGKQNLMFINAVTFLGGSGFDDDLINCFNREYDIIEIKQGEISNLERTINQAKTIWVREEETPTQKKLRELEERQREIADEIKILREV